MREVDAHAHFLLVLRPGAAAVDFIAVGDTDTAAVADIERVRQTMDEAFNRRCESIVNSAEQLNSLSNSKKIFQLCFEIVTEAKTLVPDLHLTDQHVHAVAVIWLEEQSLPLGDLPQGDREAVDPWRRIPAGHAQLRFQDAIDWYAKHDCSLELARVNQADRFAGYEGVGSRGKIVLKVPTPVSRDGIVTAENLKLFVAEHLLAYNKTQTRDGAGNERELFTFFFLPLKGLGQVRAAIDWVGGWEKTGEVHRQLDRQATNLQRVGLESLFTQSLIRSFGISLREALRDLRRDDRRTATALHNAFADLWWASEVRFYKSSEFQISLTRSEGPDATTWTNSSLQNEPWPVDWRDHQDISSDFVKISGAPHPGITYLRLNLAALFDRRDDHNPTPLKQLESTGLSEKDFEETYELLPFDEVIFACHFFKLDSGDFFEWVDQLAETVVSALIDQTLQRTGLDRSKAQALEGVAHWLNSLVRMAGRARAANELKKTLSGLSSDHPGRKGLEQAFDSLQLLVSLEAGTGLLRLVGTLGEGDPGKKLSHWFTETSLAEWNKPATFDKYRASLTHLARAIGSAFGHPSVLVICGEEEESFSEYCSLDLDDLLFPPLSKAEKGNEPIMALLPMLTEPISNALAYMRTRNLLGSDYPLVLEIEDHRHNEVPGIRVAIGSPYIEGDHKPSSDGLVIAGRLSKLTRLAEFGEGEFKDCNGHPYYFVPVSIHPQLLAQRIKEAYDAASKKTQAAHHR